MSPVAGKEKKAGFLGRLPSGPVRPGVCYDRTLFVRVFVYLVLVCVCVCELRCHLSVGPSCGLFQRKTPLKSNPKNTTEFKQTDNFLSAFASSAHALHM